MKNHVKSILAVGDYDIKVFDYSSMKPQWGFWKAGKQPMMREHIQFCLGIVFLSNVQPKPLCASQISFLSVCSKIT